MAQATRRGRPRQYSRRVKLGVVGIDSGMLLLIDPSYIESGWRFEKGAPLLGVTVWGADMEKVLPDLQLQPGALAVEDATDGAKLIRVEDEAAAAGVLKEVVSLHNDGWRIMGMKKRDCSREDAVQVCGTADQGGQLNYSDGRPGLAVAATTGLGDGLYEVWATIVDMGGGLGERVTKLEVVLLES